MQTAILRLLARGALIGAMLMAQPGFAQPIVPQTRDQPATPEDADARAWQDVISGQIDAFRAHDAAKAIGFASISFRQLFADPEDFYAAIVASGYEPIIKSRSHSFGSYSRFEPDKVAQVVRLIGADLAVYEAVYVLDKESDGWRVRGVILSQQGIGA